MTTRRLLQTILFSLAFIAGLEVYLIEPPDSGNHHPYISGPPGSLSWKLLAQAKEFGFKRDMAYTPRFYPASVKQLNDQEVVVKGYMVSLQTKEKVSHFLLVPFPPTCPFCVPGGPNQIIETHTGRPVRYSLAPVLIRGTFRLHEDAMSGIFYDVDNAVVLAE